MQVRDTTGASTPVLPTHAQTRQSVYLILDHMCYNQKQRSNEMLGASNAEQRPCRYVISDISRYSFYLL